MVHGGSDMSKKYVCAVFCCALSQLKLENILGFSLAVVLFFYIRERAGSRLNVL